VLLAGLAEILADKWQEVIRHLILEEQRMWELVGLIDSTVVRLVMITENFPVTC
jgi:hypothetical protein